MDLKETLYRALRKKRDLLIHETMVGDFCVKPSLSMKDLMFKVLSAVFKSYCFSTRKQLIREGDDSYEHNKVLLTCGLIVETTLNYDILRHCTDMTIIFINNDRVKSFICYDTDIDTCTDKEFITEMTYDIFSAIEEVLLS